MSYKTVEVEIDLSDFTDEELRDELAERLGGSDLTYNQSIRELYDLLHMGKDEQALAVLKVFVCDQLGRVL